MNTANLAPLSLPSWAKAKLHGLIKDKVANEFTGANGEADNADHQCQPLPQ